MKILWATPYCQPSAIARFSAIVVAALRQRGHEVAVYRTEVGESLQLAAIECAHVIDLEDEADRLWVQSADIVFGNVGDHFGYHGGLLALMDQRPVVGILHDWYVLGLMWGWRRALGDEAGIRSYVDSLYGPEAVSVFDQATVESMMQDAANHFPMTEWITGNLLGAVIHSEFYRARVEAGCPGPVEKISLAYPAPPARPAGNSHRKNAQFAVRTFGVVNTNKCVNLVIEAIAGDAVLRRSVEYRVLGGVTDEYRAKLIAQAESLGYGGLVLEGVVSQDRLHQGMAEADVICCLRNPTLEGASASAIEGMQSGAPIIVTDTGFYADLPDDCVLKVRPGDEVNAVRAHFHRLIANPAEASRISAAAASWAGREFSAEAYVDRLDQCFERFIDAEPYVSAGRAFGRELGRLGLTRASPAVKRTSALISRAFSLE